MIDINKIRKMLQAQCEPEAVLTLANATKADVETLVGTSFDFFVERCKKEGRALLQAKQFEAAMAKNGNGQMLIFLGKQYLAQRTEGTQLQINFTPQQYDLSELTDAELRTLHNLQSKVRVSTS